MADDKQETCVVQIKKWINTFYKAPCFWLKVPVLVVIIVLASIGIYKIVTSAFYYFNEPLSFFDTERLGQLGDFLGGTFNPIFGFLTVCLLLWSIFIQRKELKLTRDELEKSSTALIKQNSLSEKEYNRKQLNDSLDEIYLSIKLNFDVPLRETVSFLVEFDNGTPQTSYRKDDKGIRSLRDIFLMNDFIPSEMLRKIEARKKIESLMHNPNTPEIELREKIIAIKILLRQAKEITLELNKITNINCINEYKAVLLTKVIEDSADVGIITNAEKYEFLDNLE